MTPPLSLDAFNLEWYGIDESKSPLPSRLLPTEEQIKSVAKRSLRRTIPSTQSVPANLNKYAIQLNKSFLSEARPTGKDLEVNEEDEKEFQNNPELDSLQWYKNFNLKCIAEQRGPILEGYSTMQLIDCPLNENEEDYFDRILLLIGNSLKTSRYLTSSYSFSDSSSRLSSPGLSSGESSPGSSTQNSSLASSISSDISDISKS